MSASGPPSVDQPAAPRRWKRILAPPIIIVGFGVIGVALIVLSFAFGGEPSNLEGDSATRVAGAWGWATLIGVLMAAFAVVAFVPASIVVAVIAALHARATPAFVGHGVPKQPTGPSPGSTPVPPFQPPGGSEAQQRHERAQAGGNMIGLGTRRSKRVGTLALVAFLGLLCLFLLLTILPILTPVYAIAFFGFAGWALWRGTNVFGKPNNDMSEYGEYLAGQSPEVQRWSEQAIATRLASATETSYPVDPGSPLIRWAPTMPGQSLGWLLTRELWGQHGQALMGREFALTEFSQRAGASLIPWVEADGDVEPPVPTALVDAGKNAELYQQRNLITLDDALHPVRIIDLLLLGRGNTKQKGLVLTTLQTFTYAETWFPADHWLTVYPKTRTALNRWGGMGKTLDATARQFNQAFSTQTDDPNWARLVLNPSVMKTLIDLAPVRFTVDAGRIVLHTHNGWLSTARIPAYVDALRDITGSVRSAEAT